jgi:hypothetical protein
MTLFSLANNDGDAILVCERIQRLSCLAHAAADSPPVSRMFSTASRISRRAADRGASMNHKAIFRSASSISGFHTSSTELNARDAQSELTNVFAQAVALRTMAG